jgi:hypothetical protein
MGRQALLYISQVINWFSSQQMTFLNLVFFDYLSFFHSLHFNNFNLFFVFPCCHKLCPSIGWQAKASLPIGRQALRDKIKLYQLTNNAKGGVGDSYIQILSLVFHNLSKTLQPTVDNTTITVTRRSPSA